MLNKKHLLKKKEVIPSIQHNLIIIISFVMKSLEYHQDFNKYT